MKDKDPMTFTVSFWPFRVMLVLMLWPCLGVALAIGSTAFTVAFVVSDLKQIPHLHP